MPVWRNARLRRLYGKPDDPIEDPGTSIGSRKGSSGPAVSGGKRGSSQEPSAQQAPRPTPPPKRVKREKTRPESEYELVHGMPVTSMEPDYSLLTNPLPEAKCKIAGYAVHLSRQNWLSGPMFETFWTRKPRGRKISDGQANLREKMTKLYECSVTLGPHTFPVKLFTVRDDNSHIDEEEDRKVEEILKARQEKLLEEERRRNPPPVVKEEESITESNDAMKQEITDVSSTQAAENPETLDESSNAEGISAGEPVEQTHEKNPEKDPIPETTSGASANTHTTPNATAAPSNSETTVTAEESPQDESVQREPMTDSGTAEKPKPKQRKRPATKKKTPKDKPAKGDEDNSKVFEDEKSQLEKEKRKNEELEHQLNEAGAPEHGNQPERQPTPQEPTTNSPQPNNSEGQVQPQVVQQPPQPVQQPQPDNIRNPPNQLVVYRLQQMAARDPSLSELMRQVASGTAPPDSIVKFQNVINQVKASIFNPSTPSSSGYSSKNRSAPYKQNTRPLAYQPRPNARSIMLAIEFDENPSERYLLPKRSILEYVPETEDLLWSFLHITPATKSEKSKYTPFTAVFHNIPFRIAQTLERCVRSPNVVSYYMEEEMKSGERSKPYHIWYQIEKNDEILVDLIKKMNPPYMPTPPVTRKPTKPRKNKVNVAQHQAALYHEQQMYYLWRLRRGQPILTKTVLPNIRGQPHIQMPSLVNQRRVQRRPVRGGYQYMPGYPSIQQPMPMAMQPPITMPMGMQPPMAIPQPMVMQQPMQLQQPMEMQQPVLQHSMGVQQPMVMHQPMQLPNQSVPNPTVEQQPTQTPNDLPDQQPLPPPEQQEE